MHTAGDEIMKEKLPVIYFPQRWVRKKKFDQKIYSDYTHYIKKQNAIGYLRSQKEPTIAIWTMILAIGLVTLTIYLLLTLSKGI